MRTTLIVLLGCVALTITGAAAAKAPPPALATFIRTLTPIIAETFGNDAPQLSTDCF